MAKSKILVAMVTFVYLVAASDDKASCNATDTGCSEPEEQRVSLLQGQYRKVKQRRQKYAIKFKQEKWPSVPQKPVELNGISWPKMVFEGYEESRVFVMGDYGGVTCGEKQSLGHDPNSWASFCRWQKGPHAQTANNLGDHNDRGRTMFHGIDDKAQQLVAGAMQARAKEFHPHYAINGGDNFYFGGIDTKCGETPMDQIHARTRVQFDLVFEQMYAGVDVPFFGVLGNHDYGGFVYYAAWDQQVAYTWAENTTKRWIMPALYWHQRVEYPDANFTIDYFMIDTQKGDAKPHTEDKGHNICGDNNKNGISCGKVGGPDNKYSCHQWFDKLWKDQEDWLEKHLNESDADWQIIDTHFPPDQYGGWWFWKDMTRKYGIDLFIGSHRHSTEVHIKDGRFANLNWVVVGGGGGITSEWNPDNGYRGRRQYGFMELVINKENLTILAFDEHGIQREKETIVPRPAQGAPTCEHYGCDNGGKGYQDWQACQCLDDCWKYGNCCKDFAQVCPQYARCEVWGCNTYDGRKPCQCSKDCEKYGNCCADHKEKCNPSCTNYGCDGEWEKWHACSCSTDCFNHGNCCPDMGAECPELANCKSFGCTSRYDGRKPCQCTSDCMARGNCCPDYETSCNATCENYGCDAGESWQACSCSTDCFDHGNCCKDMSTVCPELSNCKQFGCNSRYDGRKPCQCTSDCTARGNCCTDYETSCNATCENYGCDAGESWQACSCSADCIDRGNCCKDLPTVCPDFAKCEKFGCKSGYNPKRPCQCTPECVERGDCCTDFEDKCANASCKKYGCGAGEAWQGCSCSADCWKTHTCCDDFQDTCADLVACKSYGCTNTYERGRPCQCNEDCAKFNSCCADFDDVCNSPEIVEAKKECNAMCTLKGSTDSCRSRIGWVTSHEHKSMADAIDQVNKECEGQCKCTSAVMGASLTQNMSSAGGAYVKKRIADYNDDELSEKRDELLKELDSIEKELEA